MINKSKLMPFQKILLSATLTRNPEKLEQMKLFQPIYFSFGAEKLNKNNENKNSSSTANEIELDSITKNGSKSNEVDKQETKKS